MPQFEVAVSVKKHPEIAEALADSNPSDEVALYATIKSKDDEYIKFTVSEVEPGSEEVSELESGSPEEEGDGSMEKEDAEDE